MRTSTGGSASGEAKLGARVMVLHALMLLISGVHGENEGHKIMWTEDYTKFANQATRGCCPVAVKVNSEANPHDWILEKISYRCCSLRLGEIRPLWPSGGLNWAQAADVMRNRTIVFTGDSITEQHFVALLCLAWAEKFSEVEVHTTAPWTDRNRRFGPAYVPWVGTVRRTNTRILFFRNHEATLLPVEAKVSSLGAVLVRGGWQQALPTAATMRAYAAMPGASLLVEALPAHFPGGVHRGPLPYPPTKDVDGVDGANGQAVQPTQLCDQHTSYNDSTPMTSLMMLKPGRPFDGLPHAEAHRYVNRLLHRHASTVEGAHVKVLRAYETYRHRGDAHVGNLTISQPDLGKRRDCLHWCHAPGVLDALALSTLQGLSGLFTAPSARLVGHASHLERHSGTRQDAIERAFKEEANLKAHAVPTDRGQLGVVMADARVNARS